MVCLPKTAWASTLMGWRSREFGGQSRYYQVGGRKVIFAPDAHDAGRIADKRELVAEKLKEIGFTHVTIPVKGKHIELPL